MFKIDFNENVKTRAKRDQIQEQIQVLTLKLFWEYFYGHSDSQYKMLVLTISSIMTRPFQCKQLSRCQPLVMNIIFPLFLVNPLHIDTM